MSDTGQKDKILVIDSDEDIRKMCEIYFTEQGYDVTCAEDSATALNLISPENLPDVVIIEEHLCVADGYEIFRRLGGIDAPTCSLRFFGAATPT